jgi:hypothetical protein
MIVHIAKKFGETGRAKMSGDTAVRERRDNAQELLFFCVDLGLVPSTPTLT